MIWQLQTLYIGVGKFKEEQMPRARDSKQVLIGNSTKWNQLMLLIWTFSIKVWTEKVQSDYKYRYVILKIQFDISYFFAPSEMASSREND